LHLFGVEFSSDDNFRWYIFTQSSWRLADNNGQFSEGNFFLSKKH